MREREPRVQAALPVSMEGREAGRTRDVSASGIFFETSAEIAEGEPIDLELELTVDQGKVLLKCSGRVVRVERSEGRIGVAVKIVESRLVRSRQLSEA